jgi:hypothetical protein
MESEGGVHRPWSLSLRKNLPLVTTRSRSAEHHSRRTSPTSVFCNHKSLFPASDEMVSGQNQEMVTLDFCGSR